MIQNVYWMCEPGGLGNDKGNSGLYNFELNHPGLVMAVASGIDWRLPLLDFAVVLS